MFVTKNSHDYTVSKDRSRRTVKQTKNFQTDCVNNYSSGLLKIMKIEVMEVF